MLSQRKHFNVGEGSVEAVKVLAEEWFVAPGCSREDTGVVEDNPAEGIARKSTVLERKVLAGWVGNNAGTEPVHTLPAYHLLEPLSFALKVSHTRWWSQD